ncbi:flagellar basal body P-ring formation chaperone FlgA [Hyphomicrobium sp.]|jgi:flagella basal body P-ring formation protein FlgA|uniref:flagellar basal body P-ring formation chaperone FlgA n=1 Tax=Hyphomicrobium sp. TaxID=82 RepID=UPI002C6696D4|nr:flagellar basal body P-ring formation chaperone FlgA [Hyphomicrobium sp.]HVZ04381.1 flagellar basal body P-ring formation chaperone FlgA [Hyphomicrobium sp.]
MMTVLCRRLSGLIAGLALGGLAVAAHATEIHTVYVPRTVIYPGDVISEDAIVGRQVERNDGTPAIFGENPEDLVGKVARRTLMRGELIPSSAVHQQEIITQGRPYKMSYNSEFISIVGVGVPLKSGAVGEVIPVRNPTSGIIVKARIEPDRTLTVDDQ